MKVFPQHFGFKGSVLCFFLLSAAMAASGSKDLLNLDLRLCKKCGEVGYLRKTGCIRTTCPAYYLLVGCTPRTPGPWSRGTGSTGATWTWSKWSQSTTRDWAEQQRLLGALKKCKDEILASSSDSDDDEDVSPAEAKKVGIALEEIQVPSPTTPVDVDQEASWVGGLMCI